MVTVDLNRNKKQKAYFKAVLVEIAKHEKFLQAIQEGREPEAHDKIRFWHYGGGIRGGKTMVSIAILAVLCKKYPGSNWIIIRRAWPDIRKSVIPSVKEVLFGTSGLYWRTSPDDAYVRFPNGSKISFLAENASQDPDLNRFKGLKCNGFLLEQLEELSKTTFEKCKERAGSAYITPMPPAFIFTTFNPTFNYVKSDIYDVYQAGALKAPHFFMEALPSDGDWVTQDQWDSWSDMDDESYARFIKGVWDFKIDGTFMYGFDNVKNVGECELIPGLPVWLSFDFNVDPMTCVVAQTDYSSFINVLFEFRQKDSDTYSLCQEIMAVLGKFKPFFIITGDATGANRISGALGAMTQYQIIQRQMNLNVTQFKLLNKNPDISTSRVFCNSILQKFPSAKIHPRCVHLIKDLSFVMAHADGQGKMAIQKTGINKMANMPNQQLGHLLDGLRYFFHRALPNWLKIPKS